MESSVPAAGAAASAVLLSLSALLLPGVLNGVTGVANFMFLPNKPSEVGLEPEEKVPTPPHRHHIRPAARAS